jgi:hypothetical protein
MEGKTMSGAVTTTSATREPGHRGTENAYAESDRRQSYLGAIVNEAQQIVNNALR